MCRALSAAGTSIFAHPCPAPHSDVNHYSLLLCGTGQASSLFVALLLLLFISRACSVLPFALAHNMLSSSPKLNSRDIIIIW